MFHTKHILKVKKKAEYLGSAYKRFSDSLLKRIFSTGDSGSESCCARVPLSGAAGATCPHTATTATENAAATTTTTEGTWTPR